MFVQAPPATLPAMPFRNLLPAAGNRKSTGIQTANSTAKWLVSA